MRFPSALALLLVFATAPALALSSAPYIAPGEVDITHLLAPPPEAGSPAQRADVAAVRAAQKSRSPAMAARAMEDAAVSIYRFADVLGPSFTKEKLPVMDAFLSKAAHEGSALAGIGKEYWKRPRPFLVDSRIHPPGDMAKDTTDKDGHVSFAYPSGHSTFGALMAILLSEMVPEKRAALFARGWEYGDNRVRGGVHFPTDVEAGRIDGTVAVAIMMQKPAFRADLSDARTELRAVLGLVP